MGVGAHRLRGGRTARRWCLAGLRIGPVRREAVRRGLVPAADRMPAIDAANGLLCAVFQGALAIVPFYLFLRQWRLAILWTALLLCLGVVLYWTWYRNLPPETEQ